MDTEPTTEPAPAAPTPGRVPTSLADVERIARIGYALWSTALIGGVDRLADLFARMHAPRIGDLVMERTRLRRHVIDPDGVGYLLDTWAPVADPADRTYLIEPLHRPGDRATWSNAEFFALPDRIDLWAWVSA